MKNSILNVWGVKQGVLLIGLLVAVAGCKKADDAVTPQSTTTSTNDNQTVDAWILDNMQTYYYWNDKIPANPDKTLAPSDFFNSILNTYNATTNPEGDRFSWIEESATDLTSSLSGESKTTGMEFALYLRASGSTDVIAQVLYVLPNSPAASAGLKRGDIITKVNGQGVTTTNYQSLLFDDSVTNYTFGLATVSNQSIVDSNVTKTVTATVFQANPVYLDSIYTVGSKKIGYLVYNQFVPAPNGSNGSEYDNQVDAVFAQFKAAGVNELVLDLRYNPGGYTSSSANLASLIGKGVDDSKLYFRENWNSTITPALQKQYGSDFFLQKFSTKAQNIGGNLNRLYVLTTDRTASASELIINGLRPYMTVNTIGTTTYGKNVGSITITDDTGKINWGMQPIVFRSYNSLGQSDYSAGFTPTVEVEEPITLYPLGDVRDALLNEALYQIAGTAASGRHSATAVRNPLPELGSSIQQKMRGGLMVKNIKISHP
ncbi:S41 family peptidase [Spirosoma rhododendri]|uniref:PDZ domain-containing protein n=1 Tax=Spirosoma rhododendri TaxID=2728024 RepID=A0A7L5DN75_9BACT|nr:S41 family peptidase [Spirosoma rhododendri]QJD77918.1 PDZ domain-containing protein [Spirosoma rhododendri]